MTALPTHPDEPCGPRCPYRSLYDGAQASLADLAARQAAALSRYGALRRLVIDAMRQSSPRRFNEVQARLKGRVEHCDDTTLTAYTAWLMKTAEPAGLEDLRQALIAAGMNIEGDDLSQWAAQITRQNDMRRQTSQAVRSHDNTPSVTVHDILGDLFPSDPVGRGEPGAVDETAGSAKSATAQPLTDRDLEPSLPTDAHVAVDASGDDGDLADWGDDLDGDDPYSDTSDGDTFVPEDPAPLSLDGSDDGTGFDFPDLDPDPEPGVDSSFTGSAAVEASPSAAVAAVEAGDRPTDEPKQRKRLPGERVVPELFPGANSKTQRRKPRVKAQSPQPHLDVEPEQRVGDGTTDVTAVDSVITGSRPVFVGELEERFGKDLVGAWQDVRRRSGELTFVSGRSRHRERGSLIIPKPDHLDGWWKDISTFFRSRDLYELAVLLSRIGSQVTHYRIRSDGRAVVFHVKNARGLVGVVAVTGHDLHGETGDAVIEEIATLGNARLDLVAVLATSDPDFEPLCQHVIDKGRDLKLGCHVVAARSWEWVDGAVSAVRQLLG